ncbi:MAG: GNAT family N-acetyltransferase, partial [Leifsonia sp.]
MQEQFSPLRDRVQAPAVVGVPSHPAVAEWRPARVEDLDVILALERAVAASDHPNWVTSRDEALEPFTVPHIDPVLDTMLAIGADGAVLAYGTVVVPPGQETLVRCFVLGNVRPDRREQGIGTALLGWQLARAQERLAASDKRLPGWVVTFAEERASGAADLLERNGLALTRHFFTVE